MANIKICDFGEAFVWEGKPSRIKLNTPCVYAAPEIIFEDLISPATDVWAMAVFVHTVLSGGADLFISLHGLNKEVLREMVLTLGKLPERWWTTWENRSEFFDEDGTLTADRKKLPRGSVRFLKISSSRMGEKELIELEKVLRIMVSYEIRDRIPTSEVVRLLSKSWMGSDQSE